MILCLGATYLIKLDFNTAVARRCKPSTCCTAEVAVLYHSTELNSTSETKSCCTRWLHDVWNGPLHETANAMVIKKRYLRAWYFCGRKLKALLHCAIFRATCLAMTMQVARNISPCKIPCNGWNRCETSRKNRCGKYNWVLLSTTILVNFPLRCTVWQDICNLSPNALPDKLHETFLSVTTPLVRFFVSKPKKGNHRHESTNTHKSIFIFLYFPQ